MASLRRAILALMVLCLVCGSPPNSRGNHRKFCSLKCKHAASRKPSKPPLPLSDQDAAYIAGFIDGDGCFYLKRWKTFLRPALNATNCKREVIDYLIRTTGVGFIREEPLKKSTFARRWTWAVESGTALALAERLAPYLLIKRAQADLLAEIGRRYAVPKQKADARWQSEFFDEMKRLNKRGPSEQKPQLPLPFGAMPTSPYWAGFFDAEGSVMLTESYNKRRVYLHSAVTSTDHFILGILQKYVNCGVIVAEHKSDLRWKRAWTWKLYGEANTAFLERIQPFLIVKRERVELALEFQRRLQDPAQKRDPSWQKEYRVQMKELNRRGAKPITS